MRCNTFLKCICKIPQTTVATKGQKHVTQCTEIVKMCDKKLCVLSLRAKCCIILCQRLLVTVWSLAPSAVQHHAPTTQAKVGL